MKKSNHKSHAIKTLKEVGWKVISDKDSPVLAARKGNSWLRLPYPDAPWVSPSFTGDFAAQYRESWMRIWGLP